MELKDFLFENSLSLEVIAKIIKKQPFLVTETKLNWRVPVAYFKINGYKTFKQIWWRADALSK